jgi:hypothetical protein
MHRRLDGAPGFSHPMLASVPGDLLDLESLGAALRDVAIVQTSRLSAARTDAPQTAGRDINVTVS